MFSGKTKLESGALSVVTTLHKAGFEAVLAGGCVRDAAQGLQPKDYDIATSATPQQIQQLFKKTVDVGAQFGVMMVIEDHQPYEVATFRSEGSYSDGRRPDKIEFATLEEDVRRRDFTVNGLYYDIRTQKIIDLVEGQKDLKAKVIRTIGKAEDRFLEDHLRMIRAVRFAVKLDFQINPNVLTSIQTHAKLLADKVAPERIREEFSKILTSPSPTLGIRMLDETGLLQHFLPEVLVMKGVEQPAEYHPEGDVYVHTLMLLEQLSEPPLELALGALFHDIAKPDTFERAADRIRFHGHDKIGAEKTRAILKRLRFSNEKILLVCDLVAQHLRFKDAQNMKQSTLKRFFSIPRFDLHLELHRIDCMASNKNLEAYNFCKAAYDAFKAAPPPPLKLVNGEDLKKLGVSQGPEMGKWLTQVEDAILEGTVTTREQALAFIQAAISKQGKHDG